MKIHEYETLKALLEAILAKLAQIETNTRS